MIQFSLLDRLLQQSPSEQVLEGNAPQLRLRPERGIPGTAAEFRAFRETVRRDLEWLLNTRRIEVPLAPGLAEVERSVYYYGQPDFSQLSLLHGQTAVTQSKLATMIARTLEVFEPRILNPKVRVDLPGPAQLLHITISGKLKMTPRPERVQYDTKLDLTRGEYAVQVPEDPRA